MEGGDSSVTSQKKFLVDDHSQSRDSFQDEFSPSERELKGELTGNYDPCYTLNTHEEYLCNDTSALVLDVADQIKEKLSVGIKSNRSLNGCVINRENGLKKKLENYEDSIHNAVNCNKNSFDFSTELPKKFPSHNVVETIVTQERTDSDKNDQSFETHFSIKAEIKNCEESVHSSVPTNSGHSIHYVGYESELQMPDIMRLIQKDLSEPYSIYTYRYFIHNWPKLCFLAMDGDRCVGAVVCKLDLHKNVVRRGYIAMLAVDENYRKRKIGSNLVLKAIRAMVADDADEVVLETEITNKPALRLYENLGFVRDKRLFRYYLNGVDALRLKLWLR